MNNLRLLLGVGLLILSLTQPVDGQTNYLSTRITVSVDQLPIDQTLIKISEAGNFNFSYNSDIIKSDSIVSLKVRNKPVEKALNLLFGDNIRYKIVSDHIVLLPNGDKKATEQAVRNAYGVGGFTLSGFVFDANTGMALPNATVYEVDGKISAFTDQTGYYQMILPSDLTMKGLTYCRYGYLDTILLIRPTHSLQIDISLHPRQRELIKIQTKTTVLERDMNERNIVTWLVPNDALLTAQNVRIFEKKSVQFSVLPFIGSNYLNSGTLTNNMSFNLLAGYSGGVDGFELGGLFNMIKNDVKGLQLAGFGNLVGKDTRGVQAAGFFNITAGSVTGAQLAGFQNTLNGEMHGVQVSGFNNVTTQNVDGAQITGFVNIAFKDVNMAQLAGYVNYGRNIGGLQASGFLNIATGDVKLAQLSGMVNYAKNVGGVQAAGFVNVANGNVDAAQMAGFVNYCDSVTGVQLAGFVNVATLNVTAFQGAGFVNYGGSVTGTQMAGLVNVSKTENTGTQLAGFFNYAQTLNGLQLAFINISDTVEQGVPIGFFSYVNKGLHRFELSSDEVFFTNLAFKTGTNKFYNVFKTGLGIHNSWNFTYGLGFKRFFDEHQSFSLNLDFSSVHDGDHQMKTVGNLIKLLPMYNYQLVNHFSVGIGPSINLYTAVKQKTADSYYDIAPYSLVTQTFSDTRIQLWVGLTVCTQF